jgi:hypothetical protein
MAGVGPKWDQTRTGPHSTGQDWTSDWSPIDLSDDEDELLPDTSLG